MNLRMDRREFLGQLTAGAAGLAAGRLLADQPVTTQPQTTQPLATQPMNRKPNLIFIFSDQQHWQAVGCRDPYFHTPHWDAFAAQSRRFDTVYCTTPLCSPCRASLLTGLMPHRHGVVNNGMPLRQETIAVALQAAGYQTAYFGKWHLRAEDIAVRGWDEQRGVCDEYHPPNRPLGDRETRDFALDYLRRVDDSRRPFALFVSFDQPHGIYWAKPNGPYPKDLMTMPPLQDDTQLPRSWHEQEPEELAVDLQSFLGNKTNAYQKELGDNPTAWRQYREIYRKCVADYDRDFGALLDVIKTRGFLDRSVMMTTSDHGDMDTNHRLIFKGEIPYEHVQRVPLAIRVPADFGGTGPGVDRDSLVSLADLPPTLLAFAGISAQPRDGLSLHPVLTGQTRTHARSEAVIQYPQPLIRTLRTGTYKYTLYAGMGEFLYDLAADPDELHNLAGQPERRATRTALRQQLLHWMAANQDPALSLLEKETAVRS